MLVPIAIQKNDPRFREVGGIFVDALNQSFTNEISDDFLEGIAHRIDIASKKFGSIEEFDAVLNDVESQLNYEPVMKDCAEVTEDIIESFKAIALARVKAYRLMFVSYGYPVIYEKWADDNNINELIDTRYLFSDDDLRSEYTNIYTAFIRLCAGLRNRTPDPEVEGSEIKYRDDFRNFKLLVTRLRSFSMIADGEEQY